MQREKQIFSSLVLKDSKPKNNVLFALAPTFLGFLGFIILLFYFPRFTEEQSLEKEISKLVELHYVDELALSKKQDSQNINQWLQQLDPHTYYLNPQKAKQSKNQLAGILVGIGVHLHYVNDTPMVIFVIPKSPAALKGIIPGDRIVGVNDIGIQEIIRSDSSVTDRVMGIEGSLVNITFYNAHFKQKKKKTIMRESIPYSSTSGIFLTNQNVGYAKFNLFTSNSHQELIDSLKSLQSQGMKQLVLDLRDNGGGVLDQAVAIANEFLPKNKLITYTQGERREKQRYEANGNGIFLDLPLAILINNYSASASEVLTAALQENNRAISVGAHTFGKGLVQESYTLSNNGSLNMTVARYYTPKGTSLQRKYPYQEKDTSFGVAPNFYVSTSSLIYPDSKHFVWAVDNALYQKNWKAIYPTASSFANAYCLLPDSFLYHVALGIVIYGPEEIPNFVLRRDPAFAAARDLLSKKPLKRD